MRRAFVVASVLIASFAVVAGHADGVGTRVTVDIETPSLLGEDIAKPPIDEVPEYLGEGLPDVPVPEFESYELRITTLSNVGEGDDYVEVTAELRDSSEDAPPDEPPPDESPPPPSDNPPTRDPNAPPK